MTMHKNSTERFYTDLLLEDISINKLVESKNLFIPVPGDWYVVVTDVKNSTDAINRGLHQTVNLVATGSVIACLNIARKAGIKVPFFFGGDGATLLIPPSLVDQVIPALVAHCQNTMANFKLELRVGHLSVDHVYRAGHEILISKAKFSERFQLPLVLGSGLQYVEKLLKSGECPEFQGMNTEVQLDLTGMECRWNQVEPPDPQHEVLCLLVVAAVAEKQSYTYNQVLESIDKIYGPVKQRNPISEPKLKLTVSLDRIENETRAKLGKLRLGYLITNWLQTLFGQFYMRYHKDGRYYAKRLVALSDTLVMDGRINTVISGTTKSKNPID